MCGAIELTPMNWIYFGAEPVQPDNIINFVVHVWYDNMVALICWFSSSWIWSLITKFNLNML